MKPACSLIAGKGNFSFTHADDDGIVTIRRELPCHGDQGRVKHLLDPVPKLVVLCVSERLLVNHSAVLHEGVELGIRFGAAVEELLVSLRRSILPGERHVLHGLGNGHMEAEIVLAGGTLALDLRVGGGR